MDIKVYFNKDQYEEWISGNGKAIGYTQEDIGILREMEQNGIDCSLKSDPLNHMTKVSPLSIQKILWSPFGVYVLPKAIVPTE